MANEIEKNMNEFLNELKYDVSAKIAEYINSIDFNSRQFIAAKPLNMLKEIENIMSNYYFGNDMSSLNSAAPIITLEQIRDVFKKNAF